MKRPQGLLGRCQQPSTRHRIKFTKQYSKAPSTFLLKKDSSNIQGRPNESLAGETLRFPRKHFISNSSDGAHSSLLLIRGAKRTRRMIGSGLARAMCALGLMSILSILFISATMNRIIKTNLTVTFPGTHSMKLDMKKHDADEKRTSFTPSCAPSTIRHPKDGPQMGFSVEDAWKITGSSVTRTAPPLGLYYSTARTDRSGMVLLDMLRAHAFAFLHHKRYAGACVTKEVLTKRLKQHTELVKELGLDHVLHFLSCPEEESHLMDQNQTYRQGGAVKWLTTDWLSYIRSQINIKYVNRKNGSIFEIAVHVRRGDVTPCKYKDRYLPNSHYLALIDKYIARTPHSKEPHVTIYSESKSFEPWSEMQARNFSFSVDTALSEAWKGMISGDVLIMSKSSFSYVPPILNPHGTIVYTKFTHKPLSTWEIVDDASLLNMTEVNLEGLLHRCKKW